MFNSDCSSARAINIVIGLFLMFLGVVLFFAGLSFVPIIGLFLAALVMGISLIFLLAPSDKVCFLPSKIKKR